MHIVKVKCNRNIYLSRRLLFDVHADGLTGDAKSSFEVVHRSSEIQAVPHEHDAIRRGGEHVPLKDTYASNARLLFDVL